MRTPSFRSSATAAGIRPSPHALSITPCLGSRTTTSSPERAAYNAVASPNGPPPAPPRTRMQARGGRLWGRRGRRRVQSAEPEGQQQGVGHDEQRGGEPARVLEWKRNA